MIYRATLSLSVATHQLDVGHVRGQSRQVKISALAVGRDRTKQNADYT
jgi:hypothetical protein